jgi:hypothetical protein
MVSIILVVKIFGKTVIIFMYQLMNNVLINLIFKCYVITIKFL